MRMKMDGMGNMVPSIRDAGRAMNFWDDYSKRRSMTSGEDGGHSPMDMESRRQRMRRSIANQMAKDALTAGGEGGATDDLLMAAAQKYLTGDASEEGMMSTMDYAKEMLGMRAEAEEEAQEEGEDDETVDDTVNEDEEDDEDEEDARRRWEDYRER